MIRKIDKKRKFHFWNGIKKKREKSESESKAGKKQISIPSPYLNGAFISSFPTVNKILIKFHS